MDYDGWLVGSIALIGAVWVASLLAASAGKVPKSREKDAEESAKGRE